MKTRDLTTICGVVMKLAGVALLIWGPSERTFYIGLTLVMGGDLAPLGRALIPTNPPDKPEPKKKRV